MTIESISKTTPLIGIHDLVNGEQLTVNRKKTPQALALPHHLRFTHLKI